MQESVSDICQNLNFIKVCIYVKDTEWPYTSHTLCMYGETLLNDRSVHVGSLSLSPIMSHLQK